MDKKDIEDTLWFKKVFLQDKIDAVIRKFEEKNKYTIKVKKIDFIRLGINDSEFCSRIILEREI